MEYEQSSQSCTDLQLLFSILVLAFGMWTCVALLGIYSNSKSSFGVWFVSYCNSLELSLLYLISSLIKNWNKNQIKFFFFFGTFFIRKAFWCLLTYVFSSCKVDKNHLYFVSSFNQSSNYCFALFPLWSIKNVYSTANNEIRGWYMHVKLVNILHIYFSWLLDTLRMWVLKSSQQL